MAESTDAPPADSERGRTDLRAAWIALVAALLGALVGGLSTYWINTQSENRADQRVAKADAAAARGIARVLQAHYGDAAIVIDVMVQNRRYLMAQPLAEELSNDDQKRLAASVSSETWVKIATADADLVSLVQLIGNMDPYQLDDMDPDALENLRDTRRDMERAYEALGPISQ